MALLWTGVCASSSGEASLNCDATLMGLQPVYLCLNTSAMPRGLVYLRFAALFGKLSRKSFLLSTPHHRGMPLAFR